MHRTRQHHPAGETVRRSIGSRTKGDRSRLIAEAVTYFVRATGRARLRKKLREGAIRRADRDLQLAQDGFPSTARHGVGPDGNEPPGVGTCTW